MSKKHKKRNKKRKIRQMQNKGRMGLKSVPAESILNSSASLHQPATDVTFLSDEASRADYTTKQEISQDKNSEQDGKMAYIKQDIRRVIIVGGFSLVIIFCFLIIMKKTDFFIPILDRIAEIL